MSEPSSAEAVFCEALGKEPAERAAFLDRACAGNEPLRREVQSLLDAHQKVGRFLERSLVGAEGLADQAAAAPAWSCAPATPSWSGSSPSRYWRRRWPPPARPAAASPARPAPPPRS